MCSYKIWPNDKCVQDRSAISANSRRPIAVSEDYHWCCWGETDQQVLLSRKCAQWQCRHRRWDSVSHSESCLLIRTPAAASVEASWHKHYIESQSILRSCSDHSWWKLQLESFHVRCLRKILNVHWQDKIPDTEILERSHCVGIEAMLIKGKG